MKKKILILALTIIVTNTNAETVSFKWKGVIPFKYSSIHNAGFSSHFEVNEKSPIILIEKTDIDGITLLQYPI